MQHIFSNYPQSERSAFIREMWEKEFHKTAWSLIAKVWTHIRDYSGGFNSTLQYAVAAIEEARLTQPDRWLSTYNMVLVRDNAGGITLRQHSEPTGVPEPRQLTDVELLFRVLKRGLPVKNPVQLLDILVRSQKHYMNVSDKTAVPLGMADTNFVDATNNGPLTALSYVARLAPAHGFFERGVSNIETLGTIRVDDDLLISPLDHTFGGFQFDSSTAHLTLPTNGALDVNTMTDATQIFEMGVPTQWDGFSGQVSEHAHQIATNTVQDPPDEYPVNDHFLYQFPGWDLQ
ncbi:putative mating type protein [Diaporthe ampelina]|uniref:Putative mating type protein n=2 Tax=Diaporthe ampelina TaxID=1214573 RepID=A0A0G2FB65_9PEZI|nr:putative mating type protein [Diaporthe ampelina]